MCRRICWKFVRCNGKHLLRKFGVVADGENPFKRIRFTDPNSSSAVFEFEHVHLHQASNFLGLDGHFYKDTGHCLEV